MIEVGDELEYSPACNPNQMEVVPEKRGLTITIFNIENMVSVTFLISTCL